MNTNLIHNILNILIAILSGVTIYLLETGCTVAASGTIDCSASSAAWTASVAVIMSVSKIVINALRDGLVGMAMPQPPVQRPNKESQDA